MNKEQQIEEMAEDLENTNFGFSAILQSLAVINLSIMRLNKEK